MADVEIKIKFLGNDAVDGMKQFGKETQKVNDSTKQLTLSLKQANTFAANFAANLAAVGVTKFLSSISAIPGVISGAVDAAKESEDALNQLNNALAQTGQYSAESSAGLEAFAAELQRTTRFEDDAIIKNAALIQTLGNLSVDGLKQATTAAVDLSAALGIDLTSASTLVGKAAQGNISAFSRYGVVIKEGSTNAETFANTLSALNSKFGGRAASDVKTFSGGIEQLKNQYGDLNERLGEAFTKNSVVITVFQAASKALSQLSSSIVANQGPLKEFIGSTILFLIDTAIRLVDTFDYMSRSAQFVFQDLGAGLAEEVLFIATQLNKIGVVSDDTVAHFQKTLTVAREAMTETALGETGLSKVSFALQQVRTSASEAFDGMKTGATEAGDAIVNGLAPKAQEVAGILQLLAESRTISEQEATARSLLLKQTESDETTRILIQGLGEQEAARVLFDAQKLANEQKSAEASTKLADATRQAKKKILEQEAADRKSTYSTIATLATSNNQTLATIGKAAALTQIAIDGPPAVVKAFNAFPPPFSFIAAAATAAAVAAQAAKVAGVNFAQGGIVPGTSTSGDRVRANVNSGEMILNKQQQSNLFDMANSGSGSGGGREITVNSVINLDGEVVARAVSRHVADGLILGAVT